MGGVGNDEGNDGEPMGQNDAHISNRFEIEKERFFSFKR